MPKWGTNNTWICARWHCNACGVKSMVIRRVCLHSNATSCNLYVCICLKGQFECICWNIVHINNAFPSQYVCENLEHNVLSRYITSRKIVWFHHFRPHLRSSALYMASSVRTSLLKPVVLRLYIFFVFPPPLQLCQHLLVSALSQKCFDIVLS